MWFANYFTKTRDTQKFENLEFDTDYKRTKHKEVLIVYWYKNYVQFKKLLIVQPKTIPVVLRVKVTMGAFLYQ